MANRPLVLGGLAVAGAAGYYLYSAGGDPKLAEKKLENDATKASNKIRSHMPGSTSEAKSDAKVSGADAEAKAKEAYANAKAQLGKAENKLSDLSKETGKQLNAAVDKFDKTVEQGASKSKSTISSWFGGK